MLTYYKSIIILLYSFFCFFNQNLIFSWQSELKDKIHKRCPSWIKKQIKSDFHHYHTITDNMLNQVITKYKDHKILIQIKNNEVYIIWSDKRFDAHNDRLKVIVETLKNIKQVTKLPNVKFLISTEDGYSGETKNYLAPVLVFSKTNQDKAILIPDTDCLNDCYKLLQQVTNGKNKYTWQNKIEKAFWRGATTGLIYSLDNYQQAPRAILTELSNKNNILIDAKFSHLCQMDDNIKKLFIDKGYLASNVAITDHLQYKYQILIDGNTSSWARAYWQLWSDCVIFKQDSPHTQWYYHLLKPNIHYIPVKRNMSNLIEQINWAKKHDQESQIIVKNANKFAQEHLTYADMLYYIYCVLQQYAKLQY